MRHNDDKPVLRKLWESRQTGAADCQVYGLHWYTVSVPFSIRVLGDRRSFCAGLNTIDDLAKEYGVTKSALYAMLKREGEPLHTGRGAGVRTQEPLMAEMGRIALEVILEQRDDLRDHVKRLQQQVYELGGTPTP